MSTFPISLHGGEGEPAVVEGGEVVASSTGYGVRTWKLSASESV
jgi:hypothetical protein